MRRGSKIQYILKCTTLSIINGKKRRSFVRQVHPLHILCASTLINKEAAQIFYGANEFDFDTAHGLAEFKNQAGSNFSLMKDVTIQSATYHKREYLLETLPCLKAPTRIRLGGLEGFLYTSTKSTLERVAKELWKVLEPLIQRQAVWRNYNSPAHGGKYEMQLVKNKTEQRERFDVLHFAAKPGMRMDLDDRSTLYATKTQGFHEVIRGAILKRWERDDQEKREKTSKFLRTKRQLEFEWK